MPFDVKAWLNEILKDATLPADQRTVLESALAQDAVAKHLEASVTRQADYSRRMDEIRSNETRLKSHYDGEYRRLAEWETGAKAKLTDTQTALRKAETRAAELAAVLDKVKTDYGITDDLLPPTSAAPAARQADPDQLDTRYLTRDDWNKEAQRVGILFSHYPAELIDIATQHQKVFGTTVELAPLVAEAQATGKTVADVWKAKYNPDAKVAEITAAARAKEIADAEQRGFDKGRLEGTRIPGSPPTGLPGSPLMAMDEFKPVAPTAGTEPILSGPEAAAQAFAAHRYAPAGSPYAVRQ